MSLEGTRPVDTEAATRAVFQAANHDLDPDQVASVRGALAKPVRRLWPDSATDLEEQATGRSERTPERSEP